MSDRESPDDEAAAAELALDAAADDVDDLPPVRRIVPAHEAPPLHLRLAAPVSIFHVETVATLLDLCGRRLHAELSTLPLPPRRIERELGLVRVVEIRPEDTAAWREREQSRRAKQRPPPPTKGWRTRSKKLRKVLGLDLYPDD
jgi:hypothetical protein